MQHNVCDTLNEMSPKNVHLASHLGQPNPYPQRAGQEQTLKKQLPKINMNKTRLQIDVLWEHLVEIIHC